MDNANHVYILHCPRSFEEEKIIANMLVSMERERQRKLFPWKRKGYRKHIR